MQILRQLHAFLWESMTVNNCNTYLIDGDPPVLVDPGHLHLFEHVQRGLLDMGRSAAGIGMVVLTHGHPDHIEAAQVFHALEIPIAIHAAEWANLPAYQAMSDVRLDAFTPAFFLEEGPLSRGGHAFEVIHTPGHTPGGISLYWPAQKALFTGDLMFQEGVGRTDLPDGDGGELKTSIRRLSALDVEWLLPGHGGIISGAAAVRGLFEEMESFWFDYI